MHVQNLAPDINTTTVFTKKHLDYFSERFINPVHAETAGFRSITTSEWRSLKTRVRDLPAYDSDGLAVIYPEAADGEHRARVRADLDHYYTGGEDSGTVEKRVEIPRWVTGSAEPIPFIPPWTMRVRDDTRVPIFFVESPQKAVALWGVGLHAVAMAGVSAGAHDRDAWKEHRRLIPNRELGRIDWRDRGVHVLFDAGMAWNVQVALGAAKLAAILATLGGQVTYVLLPPVEPRDLPVEEQLGVTNRDQGPDDYLARIARINGPEAARSALDLLVREAIPADPAKWLRQRIADATGAEARAAAGQTVLQRLTTAAALVVGGGVVIDNFATAAKTSGITRKTIQQVVDGFGKQLAEKAKSDTPEWLGRIQRHANGAARANELNVETILTHDTSLRGAIYFDLLHNVVTWSGPPPWVEHYLGANDTQKGTPWSDEDTTRLLAYLSERYRLDAPRVVVESVIEVVARNLRIDPWKNYLDGLSWDGAARIDRALVTYYGQPDSPYSRLVAKLWFLQIAARGYKPGCKADGVLVLSGEQGLLKSSSFRALVGDDRYSDCELDLENKEVAGNLAGKILHEFGEGCILSKKDAAVVKAFISRQTERFVPKFKSRAVEFPRRTVFGLSTNEETFLTDNTGNRRYWVINIRHAIDVEGIVRDRKQLLAEAVARFKAGESWWPVSSAEEALLKGVADEHRKSDGWEESIDAALAAKNEATIEEILSDVLSFPLKEHDGTKRNRVISILAATGWRRATNPDRKIINGKKRRYYIRKVPVMVSNEPSYKLDDRADAALALLLDLGFTVELVANAKGKTVYQATQQAPEITDHDLEGAFGSMAVVKESNNENPSGDGGRAMPAF